MPAGDLGAVASAMKAMVLLKESDQPSSFRALNGLSTRRVIPVGSALPPGGGAMTEIADVGVLPSLVAVIVAFPGETAATSPVLEPVEMPMFEELQVTTRPVSRVLLISRSVAAS